jgi:hypothetical protein
MSSKEDPAVDIDPGVQVSDTLTVDISLIRDVSNIAGAIATTEHDRYETTERACGRK